MPQMKRCRDKDVRIKVDLILYALKLGNVRLACKRLGFGKSFFYKWWQRLQAGKFKISALVEKSRRPKRSPKKLSLNLERKILYLRKKGFGPEMIQQYLLRGGEKKLSLSTIHHVICGRKPPLKAKAKKLKKHRKRYELPVPGQRIQIDVKFSPMLVGGEKVYIYVAIDECTRLRYAKAYPALNAHWTLDFLSEVKRSFCFPIHTIQTDNGHEFTYKLLNGSEDHPMAAWCHEHKIIHRLIPPGVKELNGKVERSHRIDAEYFYGTAPVLTLELFNQALTRWIKRYNSERPHKGINYQTPIEKLIERIKALATLKLSGEEEKIREKFTSSVKLAKKEEGSSKLAA
jgi:transposase InsO family protein